MKKLCRAQCTRRQGKEEGSEVLVSAQTPAKKTAGQIEKETIPFWRSFIQGVRRRVKCISNRMRGGGRNA